MFTFNRLLPVVMALLLPSPSLTNGQDSTTESKTGKENGPGIPQIADEPRTVDPATLVPPQVATPATVQFQETMLRDVAARIERDFGVPVVFDTQALADQGILLSDPVTDQLNNQPLYLLLNRLRLLGLAWRVQQDVLRITTLDAANARMRTEPYNVGDLLDAGYRASALNESIHLAPGTQWEDIHGSGGSIEILGDVVFVRQTDTGHRQIAGLLQALRKHARQTFTLDPPQHGVLRGKLEENVSVEFDEVPLQAAVTRLASQTGADIRLDTARLRSAGIRAREPVTLTLNDRPLRTVIELLLARLKLTWTLRDGVLWITSPEEADDNLQCALYDVRDLCRDAGESNALAQAVYGQTSGQWAESDGTGGQITFPQPGTMLVVQTEQVNQEVLDLLAAYRQALTISKVRERPDPDSEVVDHYYQMQQQIAAFLASELVHLVEPDSWRSETRPEAPGTILQIPSNTMRTAGLHAKGNGQTPDAQGVVVPHSVLLIRQTRRTHRKIGSVIRRIQNGDQLMPFDFDAAGGGFGGGGFGGGYFSVRPGVSGHSGRTGSSAGPGGSGRTGRSGIRSSSDR